MSGSTPQDLATTFRSLARRRREAIGDVDPAVVARPQRRAPAARRRGRGDPRHAAPMPKPSRRRSTPGPPTRGTRPRSTTSADTPSTPGPCCAASRPPPRPPVTTDPWWRRAVIYQVYVRSFADGDGDGMGDLPGIRSRLPYLRDARRRRAVADAVLPVPAGRRRLRRRRLPRRRAGVRHARRLRRPPRRRPRAGAAGDRRHRPQPHVERARLVPRGAGVATGQPGAGPATCSATAADRTASCRPTTGRARSAVRRGTASPDGQWYLHLFAPEQPDLDWMNPEVRAEFESILRFWLDRGVDGFRIDVAHGLAKDPEMPDLGGRPEGRRPGREGHPHWDQDEVHDVYRAWRAVADEYDGDRVFVGEVWLHSPTRTARYLRPGELHTAFNFHFLLAEWSVVSMRTAIDVSIAALGEVGAPPTWVLSNHDVTRHVTRYGGGPRGRGAGPSGRPADVRPARRRLRVPGRGARPAGGPRPARRAASGPHVPPHQGRAHRAGRVPGAAAVVGRRRRRSASGRGRRRGCRSRPTGRR